MYGTLDVIGPPPMLRKDSRVESQTYASPRFSNSDTPTFLLFAINTKYPVITIASLLFRFLSHRVKS